MSNYASVCNGDGGSLISLGAVTSPAGNANGKAFTGDLAQLVHTSFAPTAGAQFSIELFIKPPAGSTNINALNIGNGITGGFAIESSDWYFSNAFISALGSVGVPGEWNHLIIAVSSTRADGYCNGVHVGAVSLPSGFQPATLMGAPLAMDIGASGFFNGGRSTDPYTGTLAEVRTYGYALTQAQAVAHYRERGSNSAPATPSPGTVPYMDAVRADNPALYYRFNELSGTRAFDLSANGNDGAYFGATDTYTLQEPGPGFNGDPTSEGVLWVPTQADAHGFAGAIAPISSFGISGVVSFEAWVFFPGFPAGNTAILQGGNVILGVDHTGTLYATVGGFGVGSYVSAALSANAWHYVVLTWDSASVRLYLDGALKGSDSSHAPTATPGSNIAFGIYSAGAAGGASYGFAIVDGAAYSYALTASQVANHYARAFSPPPSPPAAAIANDDRHYFQVMVFSPTGTLLDLPHDAIESIDLSDVLNGGSSSGSITYRAPFNANPPAGYLYRVLIWIWHGRMSKPLNPWWAGYMLEPDQQKMATTGKIVWHLEGDQQLVNRGLVIEDINPNVDGNPVLDAADYLRHLLVGSTSYLDPGFGNVSIPVTMFPLQPMQFQRQKLGAVVDTVIKSGRDSVGQLWTWRVNVDYQLRRTLVVKPDQNPNKVSGLKFRHIFVGDECADYTIQTRYRDIINVLLVEGGKDNVTGQTVVGDFVDSNSVAQFGVWQDALSVPALRSSDACAAYAEAHLDMYANPQATGSIVLHRPDPAIVSGQWVQAWETPSVIKQLRVGSVRVAISQTRITMTLEPNAPTPYLDEAIYRMGLSSQRVSTGVVRPLTVNTQQSFVRLGGAVTSP